MFILIFTITIIASYTTFSYRGGIILSLGIFTIIALLFPFKRKNIITLLCGITCGVVVCIYQQNNNTPCSGQYNGAIKIIDILPYGRVIGSAQGCNFVIYGNVIRGDIVQINGKINPYPQRYIDWQKPSRKHLIDWLIGNRSTNYYRGLKGISGQISARTITVIKKDPDFLEQIKNSLSQKINSSNSSQRSKALASGVLWGDRSGFESDLYQVMIKSGMVHLIAISGSNISFILILVLWLFRPLPVFFRYIIGGCAIIGYCLICGFDSSIVRATIMGCYGLLALISGNKTYSYTVLGITRATMGIFNPLRIVDDWGMRLSFGGATGVTIASDYFSNFIKNKILLRLVSSSVITIWMRGIIAWLTGYINLTTRFSSLITSPIGGILMSGSIAYTRLNTREPIQIVRDRIANILLIIGEKTQLYSYEIDINTLSRGYIMIIMCHILVRHIARGLTISEEKVFSG